jgi:hypothetical protein
MKFILNRLQEPSTWAGIGVLAHTTAVALESGAGIYMALASALLAVFMGERNRGN